MRGDKNLCVTNKLKINHLWPFVSVEFFQVFLNALKGANVEKNGEKLPRR